MVIWNWDNDAIYINVNICDLDVRHTLGDSSKTEPGERLIVVIIIIIQIFTWI